ncbi:hypothetical protein IEQ44_07545 [Nocardioides sp. Y6]|uniref:PD-(D/E)XK nuclease-like domain-containing protein n=1 Tax=Nocardioides malaquae TaxID=2773426 RepID=A0ABR9RSE8_9ACTN|nr:hypothetical protein [Nocardioides malaquae]MBE7324503.1 hypothetical protein [Nocardioides malaquae]
MKLLRPGLPVDPAPAMDPAWDSSDVRPVKEAARIARYRRHQSWYREHVLRARPGRFRTYPTLGSYLHEEDVARDPSLNFLTAEAEAHAEERAAQVKKENGALDPVRLRRNMLSSMPLCFNLFGSMRGEPAFLTLVQRVFDPTATAITDVVCEYAPPPRDHLNDRTAFDAVIFYETAAGPRFVGIETKYTEPFSQKKYDTPRYREVTEASGWFANPASAPDALKGSTSNQLWRNMMLAASMELRGEHGTGSVAVVALADDRGADAAVSVLREHLSSQDRLVHVSLERIVEAAEGIDDLAEWAAAFRLRYLP